MWDARSDRRAQWLEIGEVACPRHVGRGDRAVRHAPPPTTPTLNTKEGHL